MNSEERIQDWLNGPIDQEMRQEILLLQKKDPKLLSEAFSKNLSFGTGGMRGLMGPGTNRINTYTIQMATQGLANFLLALSPTRDKHYVFISYDSRNNSVTYAKEAARVLAGNGIGVYLTFELRPTPFVSFGVRRKECSAGIMITASHNPKEYNGYKVYGANGAQVVAPNDQKIVEEVAKITSLDQIKLSLDKSPLIEIIDPELDFEYLEEIHKLQRDPKEDKTAGDHLHITYSPLHGCGIKLLPRALKSWNFPNIHLVDHQSAPNGDFPTVESPNPESPDALEMGTTQLLNTDSDILLVTDPDADRMAVVVNHKGKAYTLNGNQIASLCFEFLCHHPHPENSAVATTIVSTDLLSAIARNHNIAFFEVLTGFKYIGELIDKWLHDKSHTFLFGAEESYGYLIGTHCLDKDAIVMSCLIAEIALYYKIEGRTLIHFLEEIYQFYGFYLERQKVLTLTKDPLANIRQNPPTEIAGHKVEAFEDYKNGLHNLPPSNVVALRLEGKSKILIRPSGTEPKLKIYATLHSPTFTTYEEALKEHEPKIQKLLDATEALL